MLSFILGNTDSEMVEIARVVKAAGHLTFNACIKGQKVNAETAYQGDSLSKPLPNNAQIVFVECSVAGLTPIHRVDHHNPGDFGYNQPPANYLEASSLGQVLKILGLAATREQRIIAAADHCPTHAYRGECPGVNVLDLKEWRTADRAMRRQVSFETMEQAILLAKARLESAEQITFQGEAISWIGDAIGEFSEASARFDIPFMYQMTVKDGRTKVGIIGAAPSVIAAWMSECGLGQVYGNPARGYAGGYVS